MAVTAAELCRGMGLTPNEMRSAQLVATAMCQTCEDLVVRMAAKGLSDEKCVAIAKAATAILLAGMERTPLPR